MDWRSLTQVKEFGIYFPNAPTVAAELVKVFEQYWILGTTNAVPATWPPALETKYTIESPMPITMNGAPHTHTQGGRRGGGVLAPSHIRCNHYAP